MESPLEIAPVAAAQALRAGALLLDVREHEELAVCCIAGCCHIPMDEVAGRLAELPRDQPLLVICHHGGRSMAVTQFLRANGFAQATNIDGGIDAWAGLVDNTLARY